MRIALISDVHANLEALEAVLTDIKKEGVDKIYCLGDIVGYGPNPKECVALVRERCDIVVKGNHEVGLLDDSYARSNMSSAAYEVIQWTRVRLRFAEMAYLDDLPY